MIIFENVTKDFGVGEPALRNVTFAINPGEFVVLTGHSGAGKTTIARLLTKEYTPTEGSIIFDGTDLSTINRGHIHHHRRRIGVVYQDYKLLPDLTVGENIALALHIIGKKKDEIQQRIQDLLHLVQLPEKEHLFPSQLSGGEAQRISIARALATAPAVLFADEPTGNLDSETAGVIVQILKKVNEVGTTIIMATHDNLTIGDTSHRIFHLDKGNLSIFDKQDKRDSKEVKKHKKTKVEITIQDPKKEATPDDSSVEESHNE